MVRQKEIETNNHRVIIVLSNIALLIWGVGMQCNGLYLVLLMSWMNMMLYSMFKMGERVLLFAFGVSFFIFLLGRDGLEQLFGYPPETIFQDRLNTHAYIAMLCALWGVWLAFVVFHLPYSKNNQPILTTRGKIQARYVRQASRMAFFLTYPFGIVLNLGIAYFIMKYGYYSYYTDLSGILAQSPLLYLISKIELMLPAAFAIFMATLPSKAEFKPLAKLYLFYLFLTLGSGQRATFLLGLLLFFIFLIYMQQIRPEELWFKKRYYKLLIISLPFIAISASLFNAVRFDREQTDVTVVERFGKFFYEQGVTSNIVKRAYEYQDEIPKQKDYYVMEFLHSGLLARIMGNEVYGGNDIDHATKGGSFTHALGYTVMGDAYLMGGGTGSSYIAELFYDFGYIGVVLGSIIYGYLFSWVTNFKTASLFKRALGFIIITQLLWAPRAAFSGFLAFLLSPSIMGLLLFIFGYGMIQEYRYLNKRHELSNKYPHLK